MKDAATHARLALLYLLCFATAVYLAFSAHQHHMPAPAVICIAFSVFYATTNAVDAITRGIKAAHADRKTGATR